MLNFAESIKNEAQKNFANLKRAIEIDNQYNITSNSFPDLPDLFKSYVIKQVKIVSYYFLCIILINKMWNYYFNNSEYNI